MSPSSEHNPSEHLPAGLPALSVGGTDEAVAHLEHLLAAGAKVRVVARRPGAALSALCEQHGLTLHQRPVQDEDFAGIEQVYIATRDKAEDVRAAAAAWARMLPVVVAGRPELSTFSLPDSTQPVSIWQTSPEAESNVPASHSRLPPVTRLKQQFLHWLGLVPPAPRPTSPRKEEALPPADGAVYILPVRHDSPDLLTLRAHRLLQTADVILHDPGMPQGLLALAGPKALLQVSTTPPGEETARILENLARQGYTVVQLTAVDPQESGLQQQLSALHDSGIAAQLLPAVVAAGSLAGTRQGLFSAHNAGSHTAPVDSSRTPHRRGRLAPSLMEMAFPVPFSATH